MILNNDIKTNVSNVSRHNVQNLEKGASAAKSMRQKSFKETLVEVSGVPQSVQEISSASLSATLINAFSDWGASKSTLTKVYSRMAPENRTLIELQMLVGKVNLQSHVGVQIGEAISSSLKRIQQMGAS